MSNTDIETGQIKVNDSNCSICYEDITEGSGLLRLGCNHSFHPKCVSIWLKEHNRCPLCRKSPGKLDSISFSAYRSNRSALSVRSSEPPVALAAMAAALAAPEPAAPAPAAPTEPEDGSLLELVTCCCCKGLVTLYTIFVALYLACLVPLGIALGYKALDHPYDILFLTLSIFNLLYSCIARCILGLSE